MGGLLWAAIANGQVNSFEQSTDLNGWSCNNGTIALSAEKVKIGKSALLWEPSEGSVLTANDIERLKTVSTKSKGGVNLWIYNTTPVDESLQISFHTEAGIQKCKVDFNLNFNGWRCLWVCFAEDLGHDRTQLSTMKMTLPNAALGKVYLDYIEFMDTSSWQRMPDFQSRVIRGDATYISAREAEMPTPVELTTEQDVAIDVINQRLEEWYLGNGRYAADATFKKRRSAVNSWINTGKRRMPTIESNGTVDNSGLFSLGFDGKSVDGVTLKTFRNINESCMMQLAFDYRLNKTQASLDKVHEIYDWYYDQGWADGSALGTLYLEMLRTGGFYHSAYLLRETLSQEQRERIVKAQHWYTRLGDAYAISDTPGELADYIRALALPKLHAILMQDGKAQQAASLQEYALYLNNAFTYAPGFAGSFKPDGSGYHHRGSYMSAYYPQVLYVASLLYYLLHDTPYQLDDSIYHNLREGLLAFRFMCGEYSVPCALSGRFPTSTEVLHTLLPAYAYLLQSKDETDTELQQAFIRLWNPAHESIDSYLSKTATDITYTRSLGEMELLLSAVLKGGEAEPELVGSKYMPYSGLLIARQPEFMFTVKGCSKYVWDYESSSSENLYGRYLSNGHVEYMDLVNNVSTMQSATWDWLHLPGTTAKQVTLDELNYKTVTDKHRNFSDQTFLGGIAFADDVSLFTVRLHDNAIDKSFYADKSYFVFGNVVYCLGSGIKLGTAGYEVHTTLFQNSKAASINQPIEKKSDNLLLDNWGNAYLLHNGTAVLEETDGFQLGYINHGKAPNNGEYAYTWIIKPTDEQLNQYISVLPLEVMMKGDEGHALWNKEQNIYMASIFKEGTVAGGKYIRSLNKPMLFVIKEQENGALDVAFSNPDMDRESAANNNALPDDVVIMEGRVSEVVFTIEGEYQNADPASPVVVVYKDGMTTVSYPASYDGQTYRVSLQKIGTGIASTEKGKVTVEKEGNAYRIHSAGLPFVAEAISTNGYKLQTLESRGESLLFSVKDSLSAEVVLLRVTTPEEVVVRKL